MRVDGRIAVVGENIIDNLVLDSVDHHGVVPVVYNRVLFHHHARRCGVKLNTHGDVVLNHIVGNQVPCSGRRVPVDPLIGVDIARPPVVVDVTAGHLDVVSAVLI